MATLTARTKGTVFDGGTVTCMARIANDAATTQTNLVQSDISTITYSVWLLDDSDPDSRTTVTGHAAVSLVVSEVVFDTLRTHWVWTEDATGYNFRHTVPISSSAAFTLAGRRYLIEYTITPTTGQKFPLGFEVMCV